MKKENSSLGILKMVSLTLASLPILGTQAFARQIEPLGKAVGRVLGTTKASKKSLEGQTVFYSRVQDKPSQVAVVTHAMWGGRCSHEWVIGLDYATNKVTKIAVTELGCPHADPINEASYLDQYRGKGPADIKSVKRLNGINTVAKATGSSDLTNEEVVKAIALVQKNHAAF